MLSGLRGGLPIRPVTAASLLAAIMPPSYHHRRPTPPEPSPPPPPWPRPPEPSPPQKTFPILLAERTPLSGVPPGIAEGPSLLLHTVISSISAIVMLLLACSLRFQSHRRLGPLRGTVVQARPVLQAYGVIPMSGASVDDEEPLNAVGEPLNAVEEYAANAPALSLLPWHSHTHACSARLM